MLLIQMPYVLLVQDVHVELAADGISILAKMCCQITKDLAFCAAVDYMKLFSHLCIHFFLPNEYPKLNAESAIASADKSAVDKGTLYSVISSAPVSFLVALRAHPSTVGIWLAVFLPLFRAVKVWDSIDKLARTPRYALSTLTTYFLLSLVYH